MTEQRYAQWENLNSYRNYPFAEHADLLDSDGNELAADVFVDAILNPIVHEEAPVYLESVSKGEIVVSCGSVRMSGNGSAGGTVDLFDGYGRRAGAIVCGAGWERELSTMRDRKFHAEFSSAVSCPIVYNWVEGFVHDGFRSSRRDVEFSGDDAVTPVLERNGDGWSLHFDAFYDPGMSPENEGAIRQVVFASVGQTVFEVDQASDASVILWTPQLDRDDVCWQAHREDSVAEVVDTCERGTQPACPTPTIPYSNKRFDVCPTDEGEVTLVADDFVNYKNPVKVSTVESPEAPNVPHVEAGMTQENLLAQGDRLLSRPRQVGNGLEISIPGLKNAF